MANNIRVDSKELIQFGIELGTAGAATAGAVLNVFEDGAGELRDEWRRNAVVSSRYHARFYPATIDYSQLPGATIDFEVGPRRKGQGNLGPILEFGSVNNPPHLDGQRAADDVIPRLERRVLLAAEDVFGRA